MIDRAWHEYANHRRRNNGHNHLHKTRVRDSVRSLRVLGTNDLVRASHAPTERTKARRRTSSGGIGLRAKLVS